MSLRIHFILGTFFLHFVTKNTRIDDESNTQNLASLPLRLSSRRDLGSNLSMLLLSAMPRFVTSSRLCKSRIEKFMSLRIHLFSIHFFFTLLRKNTRIDDESNTQNLVSLPLRLSSRRDLSPNLSILLLPAMPRSLRDDKRSG